MAILLIKLCEIEIIVYNKLFLYGSKEYKSSFYTENFKNNHSIRNENILKLQQTEHLPWQQCDRLVSLVF